MSEGGIPFTNQERTYLQECRTNSFVGSLVPSIVFGATVRRALGEQFRYRNIVGVVATSAIAATLHSMSRTICLRNFAEQPLFPTAVALRTTLRGTHPSHYILKEFDRKFPRHDDEAVKAGETRLGRVPFEYVFDRKFMEDMFYESDERAKKELAKQQQQQQQQASSAAATTIATSPVSQELSQFQQALPPPPSPSSNPHLPLYSTESLRDAYDKDSVSDDPFDLMTSRSSIDADISTDSTPIQHNNRNTSRANHSFSPSASSVSSLPSLTSSYSPSRSSNTSSPTTTPELNLYAAPTKVRVKYNQYGDEVYEEEDENKK